MKKISLAVLMILLLTPFAHAQTVFKCKDEKGNPVFQQTACEEKTVTGDTTQEKLWRKMRVLSAQGKKILGSLRGDIESIKQCNRDIKAFKLHIDAIGEKVEEVKYDYPNLEKAYEALQTCASECRTSAEANCRSADVYLDKAVYKLTEF